MITNLGLLFGLDDLVFGFIWILDGLVDTLGCGCLCLKCLIYLFDGFEVGVYFMDYVVLFCGCFCDWHCLLALIVLLCVNVCLLDCIC